MVFVIVGASAGLGRILAEAFAAAGHDLILVARGGRDLEAIRHDLTIRYESDVKVFPIDLSESGAAQRLMGEIDRQAVDGVLLPLGLADDDDVGDLPAQDIARLIYVNLASVIELTQAFGGLFRQRRKGVIVGFGSIASARGRSSNMIYSAAKRGLESWFESLRHRLWRDGVIVQFYIPGYLRTGMTFGRKVPLPPASPGRLAEDVLGNLDKDFGVRYFPRYWYFVTLALKAVPWVVFRQLRF